MTNEECDLLCDIASKPGRRIMINDIPADRRDIAKRLRSSGFLVAFVGDWMALTDGGYEAMIRHCAGNF